MIRLVERSEAELTLSLESLDDCREIARSIAEVLRGRLPSVVGLTGTLGAGKTQWTKFFAESLGANPSDVSSPTFVLIHPLATEPPVYHIDAYRIVDSDEFLELGIEELFESPAITVIEWANRFPDCMPKGALWVHLDTQDATGTQRQLTIRNFASFPGLKERLLSAMETGPS